MNCAKILLQRQVLPGLCFYLEVVNIAGFLGVRKKKSESSGGLLESLQHQSHFNPSVSSTASPSARNRSRLGWQVLSLVRALQRSRGRSRAAPRAELLRRVLAAGKRQTRGPLATAHNSDDCSGDVTI